MAIKSLKRKLECKFDLLYLTISVMEIPSLSYLDAMLSNERLKDIQKRRGNDAPQLIVHFTPPEILSLPQYQEWISGYVFILSGKQY